MTEQFKHQSVLLNESVDALQIFADGIYIDGTFGRGGHSRLILSQLGKNGKLLVIDRDPQAIAVAEQLALDDARVTVLKGPFSHLQEYVEQLGLSKKINGVLLDLGVSSPQLDDPSRGFSFLRDGPLDMRMDPTRGQTAAQWLEKAELEDIVWVLKTFGEEKFARRIATAIIEQRAQQPVRSTLELANLISQAMPVKEKHKHPATRSFQAIRIFINSELDEISQALEGAVEVLAPDGRLSVISFHSLEDRLVKRFIRKQQKGKDYPPGLPLTEAQLNEGRTLKAIGKAYKPSLEEVSQNSRSRSSVLRVAQRINL
ncbi:16S rRNA (cytosine(1402)-N(4))-methyltransferase RsmH [Celerinatantimonas sp. MCCC 1A17872]|uniref:16S rRNA (cytosine(1402)-N(4))-methyltransferase RsmH n=1 Tax=Celerinatantimonas sp. MCCC 1A17872 TaxID=3177514 RepID=UPI0038C66E68